MLRKSLIVAVALALLVTAVVSIAAVVNKYQVTGPVVAVTPDSITVKKGNDNWELARDANTKVNGELKVGAKVTIEYRMIATSVEVKADKAPATKKK
jgi:hypothetical protein